MVELRYSLWRVPMALHAMVTAVEEEKVNKVGYHSPTYHTIYDNKQKDERSCHPFFLAGKKVHEAGIESESSEGVY